MAFESFPNTQYLIPDTALSTTQLALTTPDLEDMPNIRLPFGIDLSRYNTSADGKKQVDFDIINATNPPLVSFIAMRAGISWGYQDPWFNFYFKEAHRIGKIRMPYHVVYPGESAGRQMENFFRIVGNVDYDTVPLVLDLELDHGQTKARITQTTIQCLSIILQRTGRIPVIYSRAGWVNQFLHVPDLPPVHWWLAQYRHSLPYPLYTPEYPSPPTLPQGVADWKFHQTTQRGRSIGAPGMYYMDHNRFNGSLEELNAWAGLAAEETLICPFDLEPCVRGRLPQATTERRAQLSQEPPAGGVRHSPRSESGVGSSGKTPLGTTPPVNGHTDPVPRPRSSVSLPAWIVHKQKQSPINPKEI